MGIVFFSQGLHDGFLPRDVSPLLGDFCSISNQEWRGFEIQSTAGDIQSTADTSDGMGSIKPGELAVVQPQLRAKTSSIIYHTIDGPSHRPTILPAGLPAGGQ